MHLILLNAKYEAIRFISLKKPLRELIGETNFEIHGRRLADEQLPEFGDVSFIEELENHYLDPSK